MHGTCASRRTKSIRNRTVSGVVSTPTPIRCTLTLHARATVSSSGLPARIHGSILLMGLQRIIVNPSTPDISHAPLSARPASKVEQSLSNPDSRQRSDPSAAHCCVLVTLPDGGDSRAAAEATPSPCAAKCSEHHPQPPSRPATHPCAKALHDVYRLSLVCRLSPDNERELNVSLSGVSQTTFCKGDKHLSFVNPPLTTRHPTRPTHPHRKDPAPGPRGPVDPPLCKDPESTGPQGPGVHEWYHHLNLGNVSGWRVTVSSGWPADR
jgi:hypothetical protein